MDDKQELQDLLNRSVAHVRQQGKPSMRNAKSLDDAGCMYRSPDGLSCAAAPFIIIYDAGMDDGEEAGGWSNFFTNSWRDHLEPLAVKHQSFVRRLQKCHDDASRDRHRFLEHYEAFVADLAAEFSLDVPPLAAH